MSWDEEDYDYEDDWDDDQTRTVPCKNCGCEIYEEAERCPSCGVYVLAASSTFDSKPFWSKSLTFMIVILIIMSLLGFFGLW